MNNKYDIVKRYYNLKLWNIDRVKNSVVKGWITPEQFEEITGIPYSEEV